MSERRSKQSNRSRIPQQALPSKTGPLAMPPTTTTAVATQDEPNEWLLEGGLIVRSKSGKNGKRKLVIEQPRPDHHETSASLHRAFVEMEQILQGKAVPPSSSPRSSTSSPLPSPPHPPPTTHEHQQQALPHGRGGKRSKRESVIGGKSSPSPRLAPLLPSLPLPAGTNQSFSPISTTTTANAAPSNNTPYEYWQLQTNSKRNSNHLPFSPPPSAADEESRNELLERIRSMASVLSPPVALSPDAPLPSSLSHRAASPSSFSMPATLPLEENVEEATSPPLSVSDYVACLATHDSAAALNTPSTLASSSPAVLSSPPTSSTPISSSCSTKEDKKLQDSLLELGCGLQFIRRQYGRRALHESAPSIPSVSGVGLPQQPINARSLAGSTVAELALSVLPPSILSTLSCHSSSSSTSSQSLPLDIGHPIGRTFHCDSANCSCAVDMMDIAHSSSDRLTSEEEDASEKGGEERCEVEPNGDAGPSLDEDFSLSSLSLYLAAAAQCPSSCSLLGLGSMVSCSSLPLHLAANQSSISSSSSTPSTPLSSSSSSLPASLSLDPLRSTATVAAAAKERRGSELLSTAHAVHSSGATGDTVPSVGRASVDPLRIDDELLKQLIDKFFSSSSSFGKEH
ncbi:hypothetical protein QOT17_017771 [Balamuthia mandrillaris]